VRAGFWLLPSHCSSLSNLAGYTSQRRRNILNNGLDVDGVETLSEPNKKAADAVLKHISFEDALKELEAIVARLEKGDVSLEESIAIYERGEMLKKHCETLLKNAEMRIEKITLGANGQIKGTEPLDPEAAPF